MKKLLLSILAVVYVVTATGMTVHFHYCMGKLVSWSLTKHDKAKCSFCGIPKNDEQQTKLTCKGCCLDKTTVIKLDKEHNKAPQVVTPFQYGYDALLTHVETTYPFVAAFKPANLNAIHAPPGKGQIPVFLLNRVFRI